MGVKTMAPHTSSRASSRAPPSSRPPSTARSDASSRLSSRSCETVRLDELAKVKKELEEALRQVKYEMKQKGATKSQLGGSTARSISALSDVRRINICSPCLIILKRVLTGVGLDLQLGNAHGLGGLGER